VHAFGNSISCSGVMGKASECYSVFKHRRDVGLRSRERER